MAESGGKSVPRQRRLLRRSPSYPATNLETAVRRARELYAEVGESLTPVQRIAEYWSYKSLNGPAHLTLAALKKYGLLVDIGSAASRQGQLTDLATRILQTRDRATRSQSLWQAALYPAINDYLWERYGTGLPPDGELVEVLTGERGFTPTGAAELVRVYRDTLAFVQRDSVPTALGKSPSPAGGDGPQSRVPGADAVVYTIPVFHGRSIAVQGPFPLSAEDWTQFMAVLSAMKPALVVPAEEPER